MLRYNAKWLENQKEDSTSKTQTSWFWITATTTVHTQWKFMHWRCRGKKAHITCTLYTPCRATPPSSSIMPSQSHRHRFVVCNRWGRRIIRKSNMKAFRCCNLWKFISFITDAVDVVDVVVVIVVIAMIVICLIWNEMKHTQPNYVLEIGILLVLRVQHKQITK